MNNITALLRRWVAVAAVVVLAVWLSPASGAVGRRISEVTCRVSVSDQEQQANGASALPVLSGSGRYVMFTSSATNLVAGDTNDTADVFVRDRRHGSTIRISLSSTDAQADGPSSREDLSADGRHAVFTSKATNLVPGDTNGVQDIFVRDLRRGTTERVSLATGGAQANNDSYWAAISSDGRYVTFTSEADNLVSGDGNRALDVFVRDMVAGTTSLVSVSTSGEQAAGGSYRPRLSDDGRLIVFSSLASNLVPSDGNGRPDAFVRDQVAGTTTLISVSVAGTVGNDYSDDPSISADGRYVAFYSFASDLIPVDTNGVGDVFVRDLISGVTERVSLSSSGAQGDNGAVRQVISSDGRYVAFSSVATNLVPGDANEVLDIFRHDRLTGATVLASVSTAGAQVTIRTGESPISISGDGAHVAFTSEDTRLVSRDTNGHDDVFVHSITARTWRCDD